LATLDELKTFNIDAATISLWVFKGPRGVASLPPSYTGYWVETTDDVDAVLKETVKAERDRIEEIIEYSLLAQNNEASALLISKEETNASLLLDIVAESDLKRVRESKQLQNSTFYLIKLVHEDDFIYAVRRTNSGWKTKRALSARSFFFEENRLDLDSRPHFDVERTVDFFIAGNDLLILNKGHFESTLRYKETHRDDFLALQGENEFTDVFVDIAPLVDHVGVNKIRLRRISAIRQKAHYRNADFMQRLRQHHAEYGFVIQFDDNGRNHCHA
jgi:isochorismate synthase EntC